MSLDVDVSRSMHGELRGMVDVERKETTARRAADSAPKRHGLGNLFII